MNIVGIVASNLANNIVVRDSIIFGAGIGSGSIASTLLLNVQINKYACNHNADINIAHHHSFIALLYIQTTRSNLIGVDEENISCGRLDFQF